MFGGFQTQYRPCPDCGASVATAALDEHACERERKLDFQLFQCREEIARFGADLRAYLDSSQGRFEAWYAERRRRV
jgi:hypothetical protein